MVLRTTASPCQHTSNVKYDLQGEQGKKDSEQRTKTFQSKQTKPFEGSLILTTLKLMATSSYVTCLLLFARKGSKNRAIHALVTCS